MSFELRCDYHSQVRLSFDGILVKVFNMDRVSPLEISFKSLSFGKVDKFKIKEDLIARLKLNIIVLDVLSKIKGKGLNSVVVKRLCRYLVTIDLERHHTISIHPRERHKIVFQS